MAYDAGLAGRVRNQLRHRSDVQERKMFGGLCFMVSRHMCCGILGDTLMARVGPFRYEDCLQDEHAREMDFTGRAMKGMVYVSSEGVGTEEDLGHWLQLCLGFVESLPQKAT